MRRVADLLKKRVEKVYRYRVINDRTQEHFEVEGPSIEGCRILADRECERLGWEPWEMRSEELDV